MNAEKLIQQLADSKTFDKPKAKKTKVCKFCGVDFYPVPYGNSTILPTTCSPRCAIELSRKKQIENENKARKEKRLEWAREKKIRKEKLKTHKDWLAELQKEFNAYIRKRDQGLPCISCGTFNGQKHAGHYRAVSVSPQLRFNELNVNVQCATCNNHLSGNLIEYRKGLIKKIGTENVEMLENYNGTGKLTVAEIQEKLNITKIYANHNRTQRI